MKLGRRLKAVDANKFIARALELFRQGAKMYRSLPVTDSHAFGSLAKCEIAVADYEYTLWGAEGLHASMNDEASQDLQLGYMAAGALNLAEVALSAYILVFAQRKRQVASAPHK